jgi:multidrug efflux pump subunit AcrA (membrane-fusion protein)
VLSTPAHEPVPDEALLLELVNAKTSEAQARAELDELRKSLQVQKRRADEALLQAQAEAASSKLEAEAAKAEAEQAKEEAKAARAEVFDASPLPTPFTPFNGFVTTPIQEEEGSEASSESTPAKKPEPRKADTAPLTASGGWFWQRRTASTSKAVVEEK